MQSMEIHRVIPRVLNAPLHGYDLEGMIIQLKHEAIWKKGPD
jgi:hypothetical protein